MLHRNLTVRNLPREMLYMYKPLTVTAIYPFDKNPTRGRVGGLRLHDAAGGQL